MKKLIPPAGKNGFTLVELLVSMAILTLLVLMLASMIDATRRTWSYTSSKVEQFRDAREAFESITRKLSQATLNTYWDYDNPAAPTKYQRQSELRFISGNATALTGSSNSPTHAVFFQAPLGYVSSGSAATSYSTLDNLLNTWGYFIEFADDSLSRPSFITAQVTPYRSRFRLMELMEPSDTLTLYNFTSGTNGTGQFKNSIYTGHDWFTTPLGLSARPVRVLAENILALVILPKLSSADQAAGGYTDSSLAPTYLYDTTATASDPNLNPKNQLPPVVQVTLVALDEASYNRYQAGTAMPDLVAGLFQAPGDTTNSSNPGYAKDMQTLETTLRANKLNYRIFTTNVSLKAAKWSRAQAN